MLSLLGEAEAAQVRQLLDEAVEAEIRAGKRRGEFRQFNQADVDNKLRQAAGKTGRGVDELKAYVMQEAERLRRERGLPPMNPRAPVI